MPRMSSFFALVLGVVALAGCSVVSVHKVVTGSEKGLRYYLPQPFIVATPKKDGTLDIRTEYLPDTEQQYAVSSWSLFGVQKLDMKLQNGLLTEVGWTGDSAAVLASAAGAAGEIAKSRIEALQAAQTAEGTSVKTQLDELAKSLAAARAELATARGALEAVKSNPASTADDIAKAEATVTAARRKVESLENQISRLGGRPNLAAGNVPTRKKSDEPTPINAWGPMLFRVVQKTPDGPVSLVAVENQRQYATYLVKTSASPTPVPAPAVKVDPSALGDIVVGAADVKKTLTFDVDFISVLGNSLRVENTADHQPLPPGIVVAKRLDSKHLELTFTPATPKASYRITMSLVVTTGDVPVPPIPVPAVTATVK